MKLSICKPLSRVLSVTLVSVIALFTVSSLVPVYAGAYLFDPVEKFCMADAYLMEPRNSLPKDALNCTANDVEITQVTPTDPNAECTLGETFSFEADVTVRTNANERWDTTFYLPLTELSPQVVHGANKRDCSIILPIPADSGEIADVDLDDDACGDITKALGPDEYTLSGETITMLCTDADQDNRADFTYCAAWDNQERNNCTDIEDPYSGQIPNTKSKCNCDTFNIDVFIKPDPPVVTKTLVGTDTHAEPGGVYIFDVDFDNPNDNTSIFLTSLNDEVDIVDPLDPGSYDISLDLWGALGTPAGDGVYLTSSNCAVLVSGGEIEIPPSGSFSCRFSVTIVDSDLPDDQSPELYNDVIRLSLEDKNNDPVTNGETCPADLAGTAGNFCSDPLQVKVTNLPPDISVTKTADPTFVIEPGGDVRFDIVVTNNATIGDNWDDPLTITTLSDTDFNLSVNCPDAAGYTLSPQAKYTCTFTERIAGGFGDPAHSNTVTAIATDNENDTDTDTNSATVDIQNAVPVVELIKLAGDAIQDATYHVPETGDTGTPVNVDYTFRFSVDPDAVDNVIFDKLEDIVDPDGDADLTDLTSYCDIKEDSNGDVNLPNGLPLSAGYELAPGEYAICIISLPLLGNAGDTRDNLATIFGTDTDNPTGAPVHASDDAKVVFDNVPLQITPQVAMKARVFVRLPNGGVDDVTITSLRIFDEPFAADTDYPPTGSAVFRLLDETASSFGPYVEDDPALTITEGTYEFCTVATVINPGEVYECGFTIKLYPGFATGVLPGPADINAVISGLNGLLIELDDGDEPPVVTNVELLFGSQEP